MTATKENIVELLLTDDFIQLSYVYSYASKKYWRLCNDVTVMLSNGSVITIPKGFYTDLSSVPKLLWSIERPYGDFVFGSIVHDYLYHIKIYNRKFCDNEMLYWSKVINTQKFINKIDNYIRYGAVRFFGWIVWYL
jgi:hypothetical protein